MVLQPKPVSRMHLASTSVLFPDSSLVLAGATRLVWAAFKLQELLLPGSFGIHSIVKGMLGVPSIPG